MANTQRSHVDDLYLNLLVGYYSQSQSRPDKRQALCIGVCANNLQKK